MVVIAHLRRTRGNKGELIGDSLTSHPERFADLKRVFLVKDGVTTEMPVERIWDFRGEPVFQFAGVDSISAAEAWAGSDVCIPEEERVKLADGEFFFDDLIGCAVLDGDKPVGKLAGWQEGPGVVWFEVEDAEKKRSFLVPYSEAIFREIDVEAKTVRVELPEGLRELN